MFTSERSCRFGIVALLVLAVVLGGVSAAYGASQVDLAVLRRAAMVKQYSQEGTELWRIALANWRRRIRAFVSKQCGKGK